ncbi:hypothetical protein [uncultured Novosphingobium sp.]|uniref:hypothetical protein n=1 Tax=uncultured Novosphingobium sp. TaxID=292277 RepID=UPI00258E6771|nr:hypothetical protein [uncultured Novosphingobium sp.]
MNLVYDALMTALGHPRRSPSGWHSFNAICCPHQGAHRPDTKKRGGLKLDGPTVIYHCHNCSFRTGWSVGSFLGGKVKDLLSWAGLTDEQINKLNFAAWSAVKQDEKGIRIIVPDGLKSIHDWLTDGSTDVRLLKIADSIATWDEVPDLREVYWTPDDAGQLLGSYIFLLKGDLSWPTGYVAMPFLDRSLPGRTHLGIDSENNEPVHTEEELEELRTYVFASEEERAALDASRPT